MPLHLAISNIAWPASAEDEVLDLLVHRGVAGLEVAPTKLWPDPAGVSLDEVRRYRQKIEGRGLKIVAAQALLFGRADLTIFEDSATRQLTLSYLDAIVRVCAELGAEALVFGSPRNRRVGNLEREKVQAISTEFFGSLAEIAERHGTVVVLEANPPAYGADFVTRAVEAAELVQSVNRPGLRLHLDTACMSLAGDDIETVFSAAAPLLHHFHISEPHLAPVDRSTVDHALFARALHQCGYRRWSSIEMREPEPFSLGALDQAIVWAQRVYA